MRKSKLASLRSTTFNKTQQQAILAQHDAGTSVADLCREHQISAATFYNWKKSHENEVQEEARRLAELERENARLKKMYAELSIDHEILQEGYSMLKKWQAQDAKSK